LAAFDLSALDWFEYERSRLEGGRARTSRERVAARINQSEFNGAASTNWQAMYPDLRPEEMFPDRVPPPGDRGLTQATGYDPTPRPPEWFLALTDEQRRSWDALRQAELSGTKAGALEAAAEVFLELSSTVEARANAELIGLEHEPGPDPVRALRSFAEEHRGMMSEAGVPVSNLALAEALRRAASGPELGTVLDALVDESLEGQSLLLPEVLNQARALIDKAPQPGELLDPAEKLWSAQARLGRIAWGLEQHGWPQEATNLWVEAMEHRWFCVLTLPNAAISPTPTPTLNPTLNPNPNPNPFPRGAASISIAPAAAAPGVAGRLAELRVYPKVVLERAFVRAIRATRVAVPGYFSLTAALEGEPLDLGGFRAALPGTPASAGRLEGKPLDSSGLRAARPGAARVLAEVQDHLTQSGLVLPVEAMPGETSFPTRPSRGIEPMSGRPQWVLRLCLADPARLFAQQRQRTLLFGGLIVASTLAAVFGLAAARGAFYRQLRLGALKSNFVSSVSHELRSPIASVRLMAESLESGKISDTAKQQEYFRFIGQECRRLSSLIENVLDFSRIEQGRKQYEFEPTDLVALTRQTLKLMEIPAAERQVSLALAIAESDLQTLSTRPVADGKAIQQALVNLIDNAMKHSPKGQTVTVGLGTKAEGRRQKAEGRRTEFHPSSFRLLPFSILLWVEDHGDGIPTEDHERIFERFYRRGSELRRQTQGVGIGLSIVKHIVEAHGGRVLVRSAAGQGSRFTIELPGWKSGTGEAAAGLTAKNAKNAKT
jgi:signal transduction histidine kinase